MDKRKNTKSEYWIGGTKGRFLLLLCVCILMLVSCGKKHKNQTSSDVIYGNEPRAVYGDDEVLYLDTNENGILRSYNLNQQIDAPICMRSECMHKGSSSSNENPECDAYIGYVACVCKIQGMIYYVSNEIGYNRFEVWKMDATGNSRERILVLEDTEEITHWTASGNHLILTFSDEYDSNGNLREKPETGFWVIDLSVKNAERRTLSGHYCYSVDTLSIVGENVYFSTGYTTEPVEDFMSDDFWRIFRTEICSMSLKTGEIRVILEGDDLSIKHIIGDYAVLQKDTSNRIYSLTDGSIMDIADSVGYSAPIWQVGDEILEITGGVVRFYSFHEKKLTAEFPAEGDERGVRAITNRYIFTIRNAPEGGITEYISIDDFRNQRWNWKPMPKPYQ